MGWTSTETIYGLYVLSGGLEQGIALVLNASRAIPRHGQSSISVTPLADLPLSMLKMQ